MKKEPQIELRSETVRNLLGEIHRALVRWGTVIFVEMFLSLLWVVWLVP